MKKKMVKSLKDDYGMQFKMFLFNSLCIVKSSYPKIAILGFLFIFNFNAKHYRIDVIFTYNLRNKI